ncbi:MAG: ATP-binding protein [Tenuifilaceae bacterium]
MNILKFFTSPIFSDEEEKRKVAYFLKIILIVALITLPILIIIRVTDQLTINSTDYLLLLFILLLGIYYLLLKLNKVILVSILLLLTSWASMTAMAFVAAGVHDITVIVYIIIIFIAVLLSGYRMAIMMAFLSILSIWMLAWAEINHVFTIVLQDPIYFSRDYSIIIIFVLTLIVLYDRSFQHNFNRIHKELQERKWAEVELLQKEFKLKEQNEEYLALNEELTESNSRIITMNADLKAAKEKAEESDRLKTAFLQNISHEIRTPLNGIMGFTELLKVSDPDDEHKSEYIDIINTSCVNLATLIDDLIDISRIEAGVIDINLTSFDLNKLFKELELFFSTSANEKGLQMVFAVEICNCLVETDRGRVVQILNNLISNAIKFTEKGSIRIVAKQIDKHLSISVTDTGIGIKKEDFNLIFDRFTQAETGLSRMYGGTGLGLSIAKGLVEYLGGKVTVNSEVGVGSEFNFIIPVVFSAIETKITFDKKIFKEQFNKRIKILVAEDEDFNFFYIRELLKSHNCEIIRACNGKEAVELFEKNDDFDVILMDIKMPEMNGFDATRIIRGINSSIPIIAVTAFAHREDKQRSLDIKFDDYITKPITPNILFERINTILIKNKQ